MRIFAVTAAVVILAAAVAILTVPLTPATFSAAMVLIGAAGVLAYIAIFHEDIDDDAYLLDMMEDPDATIDWTR